MFGVTDISRRNFVGAVVTGGAASLVAWEYAKDTHDLNAHEKLRLAQIIAKFEERGIRYFIDSITPEGFARDRLHVTDSGNPREGRSDKQSYASMAAAGYALGACAIGVTRGLLKEEIAVPVCERLLDLSLKLISHPSYRGLLPHFVNSETGLLWEKSEVSTVDTVICVLGALAAGQYFGGNIERKADQLFSKVRFADQLRPTAGQEGSYSFSHGFYLDPKVPMPCWDTYSEGIIVSLAALGSDQDISDDVYHKGWARGPIWNLAGHNAVTYGPLSLFTYFYPGGFFNFKDCPDSGGMSLWDVAANGITLHEIFCANKNFPIKLGLSACPIGEGYCAYSPEFGYEEMVISPAAALATARYNERRALETIDALEARGMRWIDYGLPGSVQIKNNFLIHSSNRIQGIDVGSTMFACSDIIPNLIAQSRRGKQMIERAGLIPGINLAVAI